VFFDDRDDRLRKEVPAGQVLPNQVEQPILSQKSGFFPSNYAILSMPTMEVFLAR
jgi:hypothetical protein